MQDRDETMFGLPLPNAFPMPDGFPFEPPATLQPAPLPTRTPPPRTSSRLQDADSGDRESWYTPADIPTSETEVAFADANTQFEVNVKREICTYSHPSRSSS
jgi:hypothetical protein